MSPCSNSAAERPTASARASWRTRNFAGVVLTDTDDLERPALGLHAAVDPVTGAADSTA
jgi:hypothetical protein